jgi:hypothetical protein
MPELQAERDAAQHVKRDAPILVVLGNPPYNAFAGVGQTDEERALVQPYKEGLTEIWGIKKYNLDDLYVRFFRLAERRIAEMTGRGAVCFISNFSYLGDPSCVVMRQRFLSEFDSLWFDCMNGDSRETGKLTPDGKPDPSVFSTEYNREGIRLGTSIGLMVRRASRSSQPRTRFRHFWGVTKRADLLASLQVTEFEAQYQAVMPTQGNRFSFRSSHVPEYYEKWPKVAALAARDPYNGPIERRGNSLVAFEEDRDRLKSLEAYLDPNRSDDEIRTLAPLFMRSSGEFKAEKARALLRGRVKYDSTKIVRYPFKPFDVRLAYLDADIQPLFSRPSPELLAQRFPGNKYLIVREKSSVEPASPPFYFSTLICDYHCLAVEGKHIPFRLLPAPEERAASNQAPLFQIETVPTANLSNTARAYLAVLGIPNPGTESEIVPGLHPYELIWLHALAIGYSPTYLRENADGIRQDWPRIPLPACLDLLIASATLGRQVAALLDIDTTVPGVTAGAIRPELRSIGALTRVGGGMLKPGTDDLAVTAGWGHAGKDGVTMPGKGKLVECLSHPGSPKAYDVYLNDVAYWRNIPHEVWEYTIGGYQVIKKWLSYREKSLLGRSQSAEEATEVTHTTRRLAALIMLHPALDENYQAVKAATYTWSEAKA